MAFASRLTNRSDILAKTLQTCLSAVFDAIDPSIASSIVKAYGIDVEATENTLQTIEPVLNFANDVLFALPAQSFSKAWASSSVAGTEAFLCHFNCPNPWDGPWKAYSTHILDIAFVLNNYNGLLSSGQAECAQRYARDIISFVNGDSPWKAFSPGPETGAMVYYAGETSTEDESKYVAGAAPEEVGRRDHLQRIIGESLFDMLLDVWQMFVASGKH